MLKLDEAVLKKFEDLADKGKKVNASQQVTDIAATVDSKKFQEWATSALGLLQRVFGENSTYYRNFHSVYTKIINIAYKESFDNCRAILQSAREEYEGGGLSEIRLFLNHAVLQFLAKEAGEYQRRGDQETACTLASVLLEQALAQLCIRMALPRGSVQEMNDALYKAKAYLVGTQQRIKDWTCMKEDFAKGYGEKYRPADLDDMVRGVQRFIAKELEKSD